jgi:hypothetical protein
VRFSGEDRRTRARARVRRQKLRVRELLVRVGDVAVFNRVKGAARALVAAAGAAGRIDEHVVIRELVEDGRRRLVEASCAQTAAAPSRAVAQAKCAASGREDGADDQQRGAKHRGRGHRVLLARLMMPWESAMMEALVDA